MIVVCECNIESGYETMGQVKKKFNGGSCITNMLRYDCSSNTKLYQRLQAFVHQKSELGTTDI